VRDRRHLLQDAIHHQRCRLLTESVSPHRLLARIEAPPGRRGLALRHARVAAIAMTAIGVISCSVVAGLGPEPKPREPVCGVGTTSASDRCSTCVDKHCCAEANACAEVPECNQTVRCLLDCAFQFDCTTACTSGRPPIAAYEALAACSVESCVKSTSECLPGAECQALGACCVRIGDSTGRQACTAFVRSLDEAECRAKRSIFCGLADGSAD
jgi:hypothetical protein